MSSTSTDAVDDTPQRISVNWPPFAEKLTGVLGALEEDQFLVISVKRTNRFVQFSDQGAFGMRAETTSNDYLTASERLSPRQVAALEDAGWRRPSASPGESTPEKDPDGSPNFFVQYDAPVPFKDAAELTMHTLAEILRVSHPGFLEYDAFDTSGNAILLPTLGLKRASRLAQTAEMATLPQRLLATIRASSGVADLNFDDEGDIAVRYGSLGAFVQLTGNPPYVRIHSRLVADVQETPELISRVNEINLGVRHLHLVVHEGAVYAVADVLAEPFVSEHVANIFTYFCQIADGMDSLLQAEFGGATAFAESAPSSLKH